LNQSFGVFAWDYPSQGADINLGGALTTIRGDLEIINTNGRKLFLTNTVSLILNVGHDVLIDGGSLDFSSGAATVKELNIGGGFYQLSGAFNNSNSNILTVTFTGTEGFFEHTGGELNGTYINWNIPSGASLVLFSNMPVSAGRTCTVSGAMECPANTAVTGPGQFILAGGANLILGSELGISASGNSGNVQTATRTFSTAGNYTYNGISAQVTGTGLPVQVNNLTIDNPSGVTLTGSSSVSAILFLRQGNLSTNGNVLTLLSTATQTALVDGTGSGDAVGRVMMQRYLSSGFGYKYFSSPFKTSTVNEFSNEIDLTATFPELYRYVENQASSGWVAHTGPGNLLVPMEGYAANLGSASDPRTVDLGGEINSGPVQLVLTNNNQPYTLGFNLVGNPYPSPVDWDAPEGWTKTNVDDAIYYFDASGTDQFDGTYSSYVNGISSDQFATSLIPAMQGFFVHVSDGDYPVAGLLGMDNRVRINNPNPHFHKSSGSDVRTLIRLSAEFEGTGNHPDPAVIYFDDSATTNYNPGKDALKLLNTDPGVPSLYSLTTDRRFLSINGMDPAADSLREVPLGISTLQPGWVLFKAPEMDRIPEGVHVYLYDSETGMNQDMRFSEHYRVFLPQGTYNNRFWLKMSAVDLVANPLTTNGFLAFCSGDELRIKLMLEPGENAMLSVCNLNGQVVWRQDVGGMGYGEISKHLTTGIYLVSLYRSTGIQSQKVYIPYR
jgi:fibronectin-binding autotransporter adhesin